MGWSACYQFIDCAIHCLQCQNEKDYAILGFIELASKSDLSLLLKVPCDLVRFPNPYCVMQYGLGNLTTCDLA